MSDIDNQITLIKSKRDAANLAKVRAEATKENAQAAQDAAMARLKDEFGVDNLAEARAKLVELQTEVQTYLAEITKELDEIEL